MAKQKEYWYVLVLTGEGPKFVTEVEYYPHKDAHWDKMGKPLEMAKNEAQNVALGLCANGYIAYAVGQVFELDHQPYYYDTGNFRWEIKGEGMNEVIDWISEHDQVFEDFKARFPKIAECIKEEE